MYFKGRVMMEYLIDMKGMTYDQILRDIRTEYEIYQELIAWEPPGTQQTVRFHYR